MLSRLTVLLLCAAPLLVTPAQAQQPWTFVVSGDSRDCGDVVMPAIAAGTHHDQAAFYWHLGDFRLITDFDADYKQQATTPPTILDYETNAWNDFIQSQLVPFGDTPIYLGIGNHELMPPKTRADFITQFADWLDTPELQQQRLRDNPKDHRLHIYYHWQRGGIDFINLDNASPDQFDADQITWFEAVLAADAKDPAIATVVVGMHQALPDSIAVDHSMSVAPQAQASGRRVYGDLLKIRQSTHKNMYVVASHSHYFMDGIFNTEHLRHNDAVLPGVIVGTAGAYRYPLPPNASDAKAAKTNVYGYILASVKPDHTIDFQFHELAETDIPSAVVTRFSQNFVHQCFVGNHAD